MKHLKKFELFTESANTNLELKNMAKQLYSGFKKMGARVDFLTGESKGRIGNSEEQNTSNDFDGSDVEISLSSGKSLIKKTKNNPHGESEYIQLEFRGDKSIGYIDKIKKDFSQFEFKESTDGGDTWSGRKTKTMLVLPGNKTS